MRIIYAILSLLLFISCGDEGQVSGSQFIVVNQVNGQGNISLYDYPANTLTEQFYTVNSTISHPVTGAVKSGNHVYLHTGFSSSKLRKIDLSTGTEIKDANTWIYYRPYVDSHNEDVILSYAEYNTDVDKYLSCTKIYDDNLSLVDSVTDENVMEIRAIKVANDRLFCSVVIADEGYFIRVMDLNTNTYIDSVPVSSCRQLVYLNENQLLVIQNSSYFILDTESLEASEPITSYIENEPIAYDQENNVLYALLPNAQPALVQYTLYKVNLSTGEFSPVTEYGESILGPIVFDDKTNVIISGGGLKVFSTDGDVLENVELPYSTSHIFVK